MLGLRFIKTEPTTHVMQYRKGQVVREGTGMSFFYYAPMSSLVAIPLEAQDVPFIFNEVTADFQEVSVQGQVTYRVAEPTALAGLLNFTIDPRTGMYRSEDPDQLPLKVINEIQVLMRGVLLDMPLRKALPAADVLVRQVREGLKHCEVLNQLGVEILALNVLALKPNPEAARALEAEMREQLLLEADEAIYHRRNAAVEQERNIKENELNTEIAVENKKREIREAQIEAERAVQQKTQQMQEEDMAGRIVLEEENRQLVSLAVENQKKQADAQAYELEAMVAHFKELDPKTLQALANTGMQPAQLIATAFQNLAENADRIGNLNIAPELLSELIQAGRAPELDYAPLDR